MSITGISMIREGESARQINLRATHAKSACADSLGKSSRRRATL
ncbi:MAG TPA: hypothetical protein VEW94_05605 [Chloroflexia bacterium]|nr:hypothetical protein [Chloroflexia bacterium]